MAEEILYYVASFIPENDLRKMLTVNRLFCNMAMNIRYREISYFTDGPDIPPQP